MKMCSKQKMPRQLLYVLQEQSLRITPSGVNPFELSLTSHIQSLSTEPSLTAGHKTLLKLAGTFAAALMPAEMAAAGQ